MAEFTQLEPVKLISCEGKSCFLFGWMDVAARLARKWVDEGESRGLLLHITIAMERPGTCRVQTNATIDKSNSLRPFIHPFLAFPFNFAY